MVKSRCSRSFRSNNRKCAFALLKLFPQKTKQTRYRVDDKEMSVKVRQKFNLIFKITEDQCQIAYILEENGCCDGEEQFLNALSARENRTIYV